MKTSVKSEVGWVVRVSVAEQWNETQHLDEFVGFYFVLPNLQFHYHDRINYELWVKLRHSKIKLQSSM
ncbi:MAG: hypothetical protein HEQ10_12805 [Dolichospermum sp. DEX182a]|jgi:hypothetical protein|nr:hypothetical protein [Dolichospermum sp. DEX182a]